MGNRKKKGKDSAGTDRSVSSTTWHAFLILSVALILGYVSQEFMRDATPSAQTPGTVERVRAGDLSYGEFMERFVRTNTPVVITHSEQYEKATPQQQFKTLDWLQRDFSKVPVKLSLSTRKVFERVEPSWHQSKSFWKSWLGRESVDRTEAYSLRSRLNSFSSCNTSTAEPGSCALFTLDKVVVRPKAVRSTLGEVLSRVTDHEQTTNDLTHAYVEYEQVPSALRSKLDWFNPVGEYAEGLKSKEDFFGFWVGINETEAHLHYDANENIFMQLVGSRTWTLFPPNQSEYLYESYMLEVDEATTTNDATVDHNINLSFFTSPIQWDNKDLERFPKLKHASPVIATIGPGEVLYLPSYWWHQVNANPPGRSKASSLSSVLTVGINRWFLPAYSKVTPCGSCPLEQNRKEFPELFP